MALYGIGYANMVYLNITHPEDSTDFYIAAYTGQHRSGMESDVVYNCLVFFSHHTICQCTVQKSAVKVFVKHVINGVAKKLTSAKLRNCNEYYSLYITSSFSVDLNPGVCRDKATITGKLST